MEEAGSRAGYSRSRSRSPRRERRQSRSPRRSYSPRSKSPSPRRDRRRSRSPRRDAHHDGSRGSYRASERSSGGGGGAGQGRRVYVGNLPYDVKWTHLKDFMRTGTCNTWLHSSRAKIPSWKCRTCRCLVTGRWQIKRLWCCGICDGQ